MATRIKALCNPKVLTWARDTAGFSRAEVAAKLNTDEMRIASWEDGGDAPSIPQLRKLADLYKRPLAVFYLPNVPDSFQVIRDLRRLPGTGLRHMPPALVLEWRRATERRELALELLTDIGEEPRVFALQADRSENPEAVGQRIRSALDVTDSEQSRWRDQDGRAGLRAWRERIETTGALVFQATRIGSDEASGFAIAADRLPVIVINRKDAPVRRTFSLLHEFAHLMLRVGGVSDLDTDASRPPEEQAVEIFCNQVAAAALVPGDSLQSDPRVAAHGARADDWTDPQIADIARSFGVGREMLVRRLLTLGRTTSEFYSRKRAQYQAEYQALQAQNRAKTADVEMKRNMPLETVSNYGRPLVQMILENYYQDRLSLSEVAGYLGIKTKHIPKLEQMAGAR